MRRAKSWDAESRKTECPCLTGQCQRHLPIKNFMSENIQDQIGRAARGDARPTSANHTGENSGLPPPNPSRTRTWILTAQIPLFRANFGTDAPAEPEPSDY